MKISLLLSTYERPDALDAVLRSVERQTLQPYEVVVGDDGSGSETAEVVQAASSRGLPIKHVWHQHDGFRLAKVRNSCFAAATGDYAIVIDGDIVLHPEFLADHAAAAAPGYFVQGSRVILGEKPTNSILSGRMDWPSFFGDDVGNRKNLLRCGLLAKVFSREFAGLRGIRTCNFAVWMEDVHKVNGFNEDFVGWGREDSEFVIRLFNSGVRRRNLRFAAACCHLHHPPQSREGLGDNDSLLATAIRRGTRRCERGLNLHSSGNENVQK